MTALLVVSPHLDDGVLGASATLETAPGAVILTMFAGDPGDAVPETATEWDAACGFSRSSGVVPVRRAEDVAALAVLGATPRWLDFVDAQYARATDVTALTAALSDVVDELQPRHVLVPLGLLHRDHRWVAAACLPLLRTASEGGDGPRWSVYEEVPYRVTRERYVRARLAALGRMGVRLADPRHLGPARAKARAVGAYASQLRALSSLGPTAAAAPECLHDVRPAARSGPAARTG